MHGMREWVDSITGLDVVENRKNPLPLLGFTTWTIRYHCSWYLCNGRL